MIKVSLLLIWLILMIGIAGDKSMAKIMSYWCVSFIKCSNQKIFIFEDFYWICGAVLLLLYFPLCFERYNFAILAEMLSFFIEQVLMKIAWTKWILGYSNAQAIFQENFQLIYQSRNFEIKFTVSFSAKIINCWQSRAANWPFCQRFLENALKTHSTHNKYLISSYIDQNTRYISPSV